MAYLEVTFMVTLQFLGAARNVTGSCYLIKTDKSSVLVDCGLYQEREFRHRNWDPFPFDPRQIDGVVLTHAHLDHCGLIPRLSAAGFDSPIYGTPATCDIAKIVLMDSAHIQEYDAEQKRRRHEKEGRKGPFEEKPLYTVAEVEETLALFRTVSYREPVEIAPGIRASFFEAGHILGSTMIRLDISDDTGNISIIFSGDIGRFNKPILKDPTRFNQADYVVMESTYGDRIHEDPKDLDSMLEEQINRTVKEGGNVVIPSFAIERTQELLYRLNHLFFNDRIPHLMTFVDSPMAIKVTEVFKDHTDLYDREMKALVEEDRSPFSFPNLKPTVSVAESKSINHVRGTAIIIAGSGMCTGGRIKHHLIHNITDPGSTILFIGYQARGTLGRHITEGEKEVRILGEKRKVRAHIVQVHGFSAHADQQELLAWIGAVKQKPETVFITHGEEEASRTLSEKLYKELSIGTAVPEYGEEVKLLG
mgnify:FL=1